MEAKHPMVIAAVAALAFAVAAAPSAAALPAAEEGYGEAEGLEKLISEGKTAYLLVDVRTPSEYEAGHIPTAVNIPVDVLGAAAPAVSKDTLIVVYCRSGSRSATARRTFVDLGYANVVDFGAVSKWEGPLATGAEPGKPPA